MTSETGLELEDSLEEDKDSPVPGLTHRCPDRVLTVTTHVLDASVGIGGQKNEVR